MVEFLKIRVVLVFVFIVVVAVVIIVEGGVMIAIDVLGVGLVVWLPVTVVLAVMVVCRLQSWW